MKASHSRTSACMGAVLAATIWLSGCVTSQPLQQHSAVQAEVARPLLIAHRGASAVRPEHTLEAYREAIRAGADFIEPDLVITKDGVLVARHENAMAILNADGSVKEATTNVAERPEFADRKTTKRIDGKDITGWFAEDFTLAELKTLRARERIPAVRPANVRFNDQFEVPTLQEIIDLAKAESARLGRTIGIYPETKHPSYFQSIGLPLEPALLKVLEDNGWNHADAPVLVQSFEVSTLRQLRSQSAVRLVQLVMPKGSPYDAVAAGKATTYADMLTPQGLADIASYAYGLGLSKSMVIRVVDGKNTPASPLVAQAQKAGLKVHAWTLRPENQFLPASLKAQPASNAALRGNAQADMEDFLSAGIDGVFTDDPAVGMQTMQRMGLR
ncbi:glycerophosphodiester phosphodiesterase [Comamonas kerstersii]|nr:glycerophosphodiester phosphodiesterase [Comamonas kerstersii]